ncbi:hypothetical protein ACFOY2_08825 [Nonomuraea purpurea]|uniref:Integral membrane protein n=1 Tax=Nonomuraea purpurea TaxID=1849276 RepID=A0ABV8G003_9ACTN
MPTGMASRPDGLSGVTELRLHGVGGTSPQSLLDDLQPMQVAGDRIAGFYRTADREGRHVEAYSWGGLTSGSAWRVLWLVLLPFALANLAARMFPSWLPERPVRFRLFLWAARLASFGLTLNFVLLAAAIPIDYVAYQCGGVPSCARWASWLLPPGLPGVRILVGAVVPLLVIALLYVLASTTQNRYDQVKPPAPVPGKERPEQDGRAFLGLSDPGFWNGVAYTRSLTRLHVAGSLALVAALVAWTAHGVRPTPWLPIAMALPVAVVVLAVGALFAGARPVTWLSWLLLGSAASAVVVSALLAVAQPPGDPLGPGPHELPGLQAFAGWVYGGVFGAIFLVPLTLVAAACTRKDWPGVGWRTVLGGGAAAGAVVLLTVWEADYRWVCVGAGLGVVIALVGIVRGRDGFRWAAPFVVLGLAAAALNTVMLATLLLVAEGLGAVRPCDDPYRGGCLPAPAGGETPIAVLPMMRNATPYLIVVPVLLLICFLLYEGTRWLLSGWTDRHEVLTEYGEKSAPAEPHPEWWVSTVCDGQVPGWQERLVRAWPGRVARARRLARVPRDLDLLLTSIVVVGAVLFAWIQSRLWLSGRTPANADWLTSVCAGIAMALPVVMLWLLRQGWRDERNRRTIGVLWDVATFWPRHSHPLAPPSYAERAVPDVQRRLWWLHDNGGVPLVAAHSQGTIIAVAALAQPRSRPERDRVTLVTFGSPLRTLYAWAFPAYFNDALFRRLADGPDIKVACWRNFWCRTDYIGGPVSAPGPVDVELADPPTDRFLYGQPLPKVGAHTGFWEDKEMRRQITMLARRAGTP